MTKIVCDSLPTIDECTEAVHKINNKSPGLDGLLGEFYKCFWRNFYDVLLRVFEKQELPFSQRLALITLL